MTAGSVPQLRSGYPVPTSFQSCRKVIKGQCAPHARQVAGGEFFHRRRAVRLDNPQSLTCPAVGVSSLAEGFDARRGYPADLPVRCPEPVAPEVAGLMRDQDDDRPDPERRQRVAAGCPAIALTGKAISRLPVRGRMPPR